MIRISRSAGATSKTGSNKVKTRNVAKDASCRRLFTSAGSSSDKIEPICWYSCANMIASSLVSFPVRNRVQNERIEAGDVRSHSSAYICSLLVVERSSDTRMSISASSMGFGDSAMIWAPRSARFCRRVKPSGVKPPYGITM